MHNFLVLSLICNIKSCPYKAYCPAEVWADQGKNSDAFFVIFSVGINLEKFKLRSDKTGKKCNLFREIFNLFMLLEEEMEN